MAAGPSARVQRLTSLQAITLFDGGQLATGLSFGVDDIPDQAALEAEFDLIAAAVRPMPDPPVIRPRKIGKFLYLPTTEPSDIEPRLLLAGAMAKRGWQCLITDTATMAKGRFGYLPPGVVLFGMTPSDGKYMFQAEKTGGHLTLALPCAVQDKWAVRFADAVLPAALEAPTIPLEPAYTLLVTAAPMVNAKSGFNPAVRAALGDAAVVRPRIGVEVENMRALAACAAREDSPRIWVGPHENTCAAYYTTGDLSYEPSLWVAVSKAKLCVCAPDSDAHYIAAALGVPRETFDGEALGDVLANPMDKPRKLTTADILTTMHARNQYPMPFDLLRAWDVRGKHAGQDDAAMPLLSPYYQRIAGRPVRTLGTAAWAVLP